VGAHDTAAFVVAAYGLSALVLVALGGWIALDARRRRRELAALEAGGARRRSAAAAVR
jgi:heme exporter protein D